MRGASRPPGFLVSSWVGSLMLSRRRCTRRRCRQIRCRPRPERSAPGPAAAQLEARGRDTSTSARGRGSSRPSRDAEPAKLRSERSDRFRRRRELTEGAVDPAVPMGTDFAGSTASEPVRQRGVVTGMARQTSRGTGLGRTSTARSCACSCFIPSARASTAAWFPSVSTSRSSTSARIESRPPSKGASMLGNRAMSRATSERRKAEDFGSPSCRTQ